MITRPLTSHPARTYLLAGLAIDTVGTGLFLPIALLYQIRVIGLPAATSGLITAGAPLMSLAIPALVGSIVDRLGARPVIIASFVTQGLGMAAYLVADSAAGAFAAALCAAVGLRAYWSSVFTLLAEVSGAAAKEPAFALAGMMQAGGLAVGSGIGSVLLAAGSTDAYRLVVALNAASYFLSALLVVFGVPAARGREAGSTVTIGYRHVLADRRFLALMGSYAAISLSVSLCSIAEPVFLVDRLHLPGWVPGSVFGAITVCTATLRGRAARLVRDRHRVRTLWWALAAQVIWLAGMAGLVWVPRGIQIPYLFLITAPYVAAQLVHVSVSMALAEAMAPEAARGRYLAVFQYAFGVTNSLAPAMVGLFAVYRPLPWLLGVAVSLVALVALSALAKRLPPEVAYRPDSPAAGEPGRSAGSVTLGAVAD